MGGRGLEVEEQIIQEQSSCYIWYFYWLTSAWSVLQCLTRGSVRVPDTLLDMLRNNNLLQQDLTTPQHRRCWTWSTSTVRERGAWVLLLPKRLVSPSEFVEIKFRALFFLYMSNNIVFLLLLVHTCYFIALLIIIINWCRNLKRILVPFKPSAKKQLAKWCYFLCHQLRLLLWLPFPFLSWVWDLYINGEYKYAFNSYIHFYFNWLE